MISHIAAGRATARCVPSPVVATVRPGRGTSSQGSLPRPWRARCAGAALVGARRSGRERRRERGRGEPDDADPCGGAERHEGNVSKDLGIEPPANPGRFNPSERFQDTEEIRVLVGPERRSLDLGEARLVHAKRLIPQAHPHMEAPQRLGEGCQALGARTQEDPPRGPALVTQSHHGRELDTLKSNRVTKPRHHGHELEMPIGYVRGDHTLIRQSGAITLEGLLRHQMGRDRIAAECIENQDVEILLASARPLLLENQAGIAQLDFDGRCGVFQIGSRRTTSNTSTARPRSWARMGKTPRTSR